MPPTSQYGQGEANGYYGGNSYGNNGSGYGGAQYNQYAPPPPKTQEAQYYQQSEAAGGQGYNAPPQKGELIEGKFDDVKPKCVRDVAALKWPKGRQLIQP